MKTRIVVIGIDDICRLFRDYANQTGFPSDAVCDTLLFHPAHRRMRLRVEAESLNGPQVPEQIKFDLRRTHLVGGPSGN